MSAFPSTPTNGENHSLNGVTYVYDSTNNSWRKLTVGTFDDAAWVKANTAYELAAAALPRTGGEITGTFTVNANTTFEHEVIFNGAVTIPGTIEQISGNSGVFLGQSANGFAALYAGYPEYTELPVTVFQSSGYFDGFIQNNFENTHPGTQSTTEYVATAHNGTNLTGYIDMGISGENWDGTQEDSLGDAIAPNDGWVYVMNGTGTSGGNLLLGAMEQGKKVKIVCGVGASNIVAEFSNTGFTSTNLTTTGNVNFTASSNVSLGSNTNIHITGGNNGQYIRTDGNGHLSFATVSVSPGSDNIGYLNIPQNSQSADYTIVAGDSGKHIFHPAADTTGRTFTIPSHATTPFDIGTTVVFINDASAGTITIAIDTNTLLWLPSGSTGSRTLAASGMATCVKVTSAKWIITGVGIT